MRIHREGKKIVYNTWAFLLLLILVVWRFYMLKTAMYLTPLLLIGVFVSRFFRIPQLSLPKDHTDFFYAPADGKIVNVEKIKWDDKDYYSISIFMSIWNVHINWITVSGKIIDKLYSPGKFLMAINPKSSTDNERSSVTIQTDQGKIKITQVAGAVARRIITYPSVNQTVNSGEELGFIKFGSRVDILLPMSYHPLANNGEKVSGLTSKLAELKIK